MIGDVVTLTPEQKAIVKQYMKIQEESAVMMQEAASRMTQARMNLWLGVKEMIPDIYAKYHLMLTKDYDVRIDRLRDDDRDWPEVFKELDK